MSICEFCVLKKRELAGFKAQILSNARSGKSGRGWNVMLPVKIAGDQSASTRDDRHFRIREKRNFFEAVSQEKNDALFGVDGRKELFRSSDTSYVPWLTD